MPLEVLRHELNMQSFARKSIGLGVRETRVGNLALSFTNVILGNFLYFSEPQFTHQQAGNHTAAQHVIQFSKRVLSAGFVRPCASFSGGREGGRGRDRDRGRDRGREREREKI